MRKTYNICLMSNIGNSRTNQEDNYLISPNLYQKLGQDPENPPRSEKFLEFEKYSTPTVLAVSDGMGGHAGGEVASLIAVAYLAKGITEVFLQDDGGLLVPVISDINQHIYEQSRQNPDLKGMGATLCGVFLPDKGTLTGFNVGDSRLYRYTNGHVSQLSKDHTEGRRLLDLNLLTAEEAEQFRNRKSLYKYIGMSSKLVPDVWELTELSPGECLLICTDGLSDVLSEEEIAQCLSAEQKLADRARRMMDLALQKNIGFGDNITFVLIEL